MRPLVILLVVFLASTSLIAQDKNPLKDQAPNTWVKRSPLKDAPLSPMLGYEGALAYDSKAKVVIRWAGHNQGGGGEQNAETWTFDPVTAKWTLKEPNTSPPGGCCAQQNVFDPVAGRYLRFSTFSGNHGWHWFRENYLNNTSVWTYDLAKNTWRDMRPVPTPRPAPLRCASWDSEHQVAVIFGGEGSNEGTIVYDPFDNSWTRLKPEMQPKSRSAGNMAYDKNSGWHILFGAQFSNDPHTWAFILQGPGAWIDLKPKVQPPTEKNDAVLAYDENNKVIIGSIRVAGKVDSDEGWHYETWAYDADEKKNTWKKMNPNVEPPGGGQRRRIMVAIPDQNVILMENYVNPPQKIPGIDREQQMWTYRYDTPKRKIAVPIPTDIRLETTDNSAVVRWNGKSPGGWSIHKIEGPRLWSVNGSTHYTSAPQDGFRDKEVRIGKVTYYRVEANDDDIAGGNIRDSHGIIVRTQPRLIEDVIATVHSATKVTLAWPAAKEDDVVGYHVERAPVEVFSEDQIVRLRTDTAPLDPPSVGAIKHIGKFTQLTKEPIKETTFTDSSIDLAKPQIVKDEIYRHRFASSQIHDAGKDYPYMVYAYRVRAVNKLGVLSGGGPYALTIPSAPQGVFAKEDGRECHLKWEKNAEHGIKGYRIYRMESPRKNGPGQPVTRVTKEPLADTRYLDQNVNKDTRRYWIVAVDALGQEGFPSAPVWFERQYKKNYVPFTGEWHQ